MSQLQDGKLHYLRIDISEAIMYKIKFFLVLTFLIFSMSQATADKVFVNYRSETNFGVLIPNVEESTNHGTYTYYNIRIHNSQNAYYLLSIRKGSWTQEHLLVPYETYSLPRLSFRDKESLSILADGSLNHWQVPTALACDALYRFTKGAPPPRSVQDSFQELATIAFSSVGGAGYDLANDLVGFRDNIAQGDVFGATKDLYDIGANDLVKPLGFGLPSWVSFLAGSGSVILLEIQTLLSPHVDLLTFDAQYVGNSSTPTPTYVPPPPSAYYGAKWLSDLDILDDTPFNPSQTFTKKWRIQNIGNTTWGSGYRWVFDGGEKMGGPDYINVPTIGPGGTWDPAVNLRAPSSPGIYTGYWRMQGPTGKFGTRMWVRIKVTGSAPPPPTITTFVSESWAAPSTDAPGFTRHGPRDWWHVAGGVGDGGEMLWTTNSQSNLYNMGDWRPNLPETRPYEVYVHIPRLNGTTTKARYEIHHAGGQTDKIINQSIYFDGWASLGIYNFNSGTKGFVRLIDTTGEASESKQIGFDAVKWEARAALPPPPAPITNEVPESRPAPAFGQAGFWREGPTEWWYGATGVGTDGRMLWTTNASANTHNVGYWRPNLSETRPYEVYVHIPRLNATTGRAQYTVYHAGGTSNVTVNQLAYSDVWVSLGTYKFNSGLGGYLKLIDTTGEGSGAYRVGFDSAKWVPRDTLPPPPPPVTTFVSESSAAPSEGAAGFWRHGPSYWWYDAVGVGDGGHMYWTTNAYANNHNTGDWRPNLPRLGNYEVFVFIPRLYATTRQAKYEIYHADGRTDKIVNQSIYFDKWVSLGTYRFKPGIGGLVRLRDTTGENSEYYQVGFDSVKWEWRPGNTRPPTDLRPREGAIVDPEINFTWRDSLMDDGNPSADFKVQVWRIVNGSRGGNVWDSDWRVGASRSWAAPGHGEYEWIVHASNGSGQSSASAPARFVVPEPKPPAPSDLRLLYSAPDRIELVWQDNSNTEVGFKIERHTGDGSFVQIATTSTDEASIADGQVSANQTYVYRVQAYNDAGDSAYSNIVTVTTPHTLATLVLTPTTVTGGGVSSGQVSLTGAAPAGGITVSLSSSVAEIASVPDSIIIAEGATTGKFAITTNDPVILTNVTIASSYAGTSKSAGLIIQPAPDETSVVKPDLLIKQSSEPNAAFALDNVYQSTPSGAQIKSTYLAGTVATYQIKIQNDAFAARNFVLRTVESGEAGWTLVYKVGILDISAALRSAGGYATPSLAPGASQIITLRMTRTSTTTGSKSATIKAFLSGSDTSVRDSVRATTIVDVTVPTAAFTNATTTPVGTSPVYNGTVWNKLPLISGTAADAGSGISKVELQLYRATATAGVNEYWNGTAWITPAAGAAPPRLTTSLSPVGGGANVTWSVNAGPPAASFGDGVYYLRAFPTDKVDRHGASPVLRFTKATDATNPTVGFTTAATTPGGTTPANFATITGAIPTITGIAGDVGSGVSKVELQLYRASSTAGLSEYWNGVNWVIPSGSVPTPFLSTALNPAAGGANVTWSKGSGWPTDNNFGNGTYYLRAFATDKVGKRTASVVSRFTKATATSPMPQSAGQGSTPSAGVQVQMAQPSSITLISTATDISQQQIRLNFSGALNLASAGNAANYRLKINGIESDILSLVYDDAKHETLISLHADSLADDDTVVVMYRLLDDEGKALTGEVSVE